MNDGVTEAVRVFDGVTEGVTEGVLVLDAEGEPDLLAVFEPVIVVDFDGVPERVSVGEAVNVELREEPADGVPV